MVLLRRFNVKIPAVVVFYNPSEENIKNIKVYEKSVAKIYVVDNSDVAGGIKYSQVMDFVDGEYHNFYTIVL